MSMSELCLAHMQATTPSQPAPPRPYLAPPAPPQADSVTTARHVPSRPADRSTDSADATAGGRAEEGVLEYS